MRTPVVQPIFPTPVVISQLERDYTQTERQFFAKQNTRQSRNVGNSMSVNNYILDEPSLAELRAEIDVVLQEYVDNVLMPTNTDNRLYITQSWMNWTRPGEWHHKHTHSNSVMSGVFYVDADETADKIVFITDRYSTIKLQPKEINHFNTETWDFTVRTGALILFPSHLQHMVSLIPKTQKRTRISLAFNTFVSGTIGSNHSLTELKL